MAWHTRLWRRVRLVPGLTVNLSKSWPSLSVGPRGSKATFSRRGVRQTVGVPGTGIYATRRLGATTPRPERADTPLAEAPTTEAPTAAAAEAVPGDVELSYGSAMLVGIGLGIVLVLAGVQLATAAGAAVVAFAIGLAYESFAGHHPAATKAVAQLLVGLVSVAVHLIGIIVLAAVAIAGFLTVAALMGVVSGLGRSGRRRRRRGW